MYKIIHGVRYRLTANIPEINLKINPKLMLKTSIIGCFLSIKLYKKLLIKYMIITNKTFVLILDAMNNAIVASITAIIIAVGIFTLPFAMGRNFFLGWFKSASLSNISLSIYIDELIKQKHTNVKIDGSKKAVKLEIVPKIKPEKHKKFFVQCFALINVK